MKVCMIVNRLQCRASHTRTQSLIPVVMSGIIAVYGLVVAVLIVGGGEFVFVT